MGPVLVEIVETGVKLEEKEVVLQFQVLLEVCEIVEVSKETKEGLVTLFCMEKLEVLGVVMQVLRAEENKKGTIEVAGKA